jgi:hypothetical protein
MKPPQGHMCNVFSNRIPSYGMHEEDFLPDPAWAKAVEATQLLHERWLEGDSSPARVAKQLAGVGFEGLQGRR